MVLIGMATAVDLDRRVDAEVDGIARTPFVETSIMAALRARLGVPLGVPLGAPLRIGGGCRRTWHSSNPGFLAFDCDGAVDRSRFEKVGSNHGFWREKRQCKPRDNRGWIACFEG